MSKRARTILTFPGYLVHEAIYQLFCMFSRVLLQDYYFCLLENTTGHAIPKYPRKMYQCLLIEIGPFIINSIVGAVIALPGVLVLLKFGSATILDYFSIWLGVSISMHSFPPREEAKDVWRTVLSNETPLYIKIFATPIVGFIYFVASGSLFWLDFFYGVGVILLLPVMLLQIIT